MGAFGDLCDEYDRLPREGKLKILVQAENFEYLKHFIVGIEDEVPFTRFTTKEMQAK